MMYVATSMLLSCKYHLQCHNYITSDVEVIPVYYWTDIYLPRNSCLPPYACNSGVKVNIYVYYSMHMLNYKLIHVAIGLSFTLLLAVMLVFCSAFVLL